MKLFIEKTKQKKTIKFNGEAKALLKKLGINSEDVLIVKNNELISIDEKINNNDEVKILSVVSGG